MSVMLPLKIDRQINFFIIAPGVPDAGGTPHFVRMPDLMTRLRHEEVAIWAYFQPK